MQRIYIHDGYFDAQQLEAYLTGGIDSFEVCLPYDHYQAEELTKYCFVGDKVDVCFFVKGVIGGRYVEATKAVMLRSGFKLIFTQI